MKKSFLKIGLHRRLDNFDHGRMARQVRQPYYTNTSQGYGVQQYNNG